MTIGPTRQTVAQRLLADFHTTGHLPGFSGGDHDGDSGGDDNASDQGDSQNDDADSGGQQGGRSDDDSGFKAITSQAELDNLISKRLGRERKKLESTVRKDIEEAARRKEAEEQGDFKKLYDELKTTHGTTEEQLTTATAELDQLRTYVNADIKAAVDKLPKALMAFDPGEDAPLTERLDWLTKAREGAAEWNSRENVDTDSGKPNANHAANQSKSVLANYEFGKRRR